MSHLISAFLIFVSLSILFYVYYVKNSIAISKMETFSYKKYFGYYGFSIGVLFFIILGLHYLGLPTEISITLFIFLTFCLTAGLLNNLLWEYQAKKRGKKKD